MVVDHTGMNVEGIAMNGVRERASASSWSILFTKLKTTWCTKKSSSRLVCLIEALSERYCVTWTSGRWLVKTEKSTFQKSLKMLNGNENREQFSFVGDLTAISFQ